MFSCWPKNIDLMVYVTALNGKDMQVAATNITGLRPYFQNLLTNTLGS